MRCLLLLVAVVASCVVGDPCAAEVTDVTLMHSPIRLAACSSVTFDTEEALLQSECAAAGGTEADVDAVCLMLRRQWWPAVKLVLPSISERTRIRQLADAIRTGAGAVVDTSRLQGAQRWTGGNEDSVVTPAVQWAQNGTVVAVAIRFSPKKHGPVSVASVLDPSVAIEDRSVKFAAKAKGKPLRFELELELFDRIDAQASSWTGSSAGRLTLTLVKAEAGAMWSALVRPPGASEGAGKARHGHISSWYEMQQHFGSNEDESGDERPKGAQKAPEKAKIPDAGASAAAGAARLAKGRAAPSARDDDEEDGDEGTAGGGGGGSSKGTRSSSKRVRGKKGASGKSLMVRMRKARRRWWKWLLSVFGW